MRLLDTPQWAALTTRQKNIMLAIQGEGELRFRPAQRDDIKALESLGLVTADWAHSVAREFAEGGSQQNNRA